MNPNEYPADPYAQEMLPQNIQTQYSPAYMQQAKSELIRWQLDPQDILEELEHRLRGEMQDKEGEWKRPEHIIPLVNEKGVAAIIYQMNLRLSKLIILSHLDEQDILIITREFADDFIDFLTDEWKNFGIKQSHRDIVVNLVADVVYVTLRRAFKGGERRFLKDTQEYKEISTTQPPQKKGFFGFK